MSVFNLKATSHKKGVYPLFLGEPLGIYDSIQTNHPVVFDIYKQMKADDWSETEVNLLQSKADFETVPKSISDIMIETIKWQWAGDTIASQNIMTLLAPFITNPELMTAVTKQVENENLHALTYSEIVRQSIKNPKKIIDEIQADERIYNRSTKLIEVFTEVEQAGAKLTLGLLDRETDREYLQQLVIKFMFVLLALEGIQFMASFACTFAVAEQDVFVGIAKLVQKIMLDEVNHTNLDLYVLNTLYKDKGWKQAFKDTREEVKFLLDSIVEDELEWADSHIFENGRAVVGLNKILLKEYVMYVSYPIYKQFGLDFKWDVILTNPLPNMDKWLNINSVQVAAQESQITNYVMNAIDNDLTDDEDLSGLL